MTQQKVFPAYNLKFVKMKFFLQIGSVCPFVNIFLCSTRHRAKPKRPKDQNQGHGHRLRIETGSSRSPISNGTMSNSPEVRIFFLQVFNFWILFNSKVKRPLAKVAQSDPRPRRQSLAASSPPVKSDSAACPPCPPCPPTRPDPSSIGPCSIIEQDSAGHSCQDPASFDSLPSVQRIGRGGPQGVGHPQEVGQRQKETDTHKPEVTMKCSFSLVEPSGLSPLSRRSYILVEQFGTSAFI